MKTVNKAIFFVLLVAIQTSCNGFTSTPTTSPEMETAIAKVWATYIETITAIPSITRTPPSPTAIPAPFEIQTPGPNQQAYVDPNGWYAVYFPADMQSTGLPGSFRGAGGYYIETGYLPEMGFMPDDVSVCTWLANMKLEPEQSGVDWGIRPCSAKSENHGFGITYAIQENPGADPEHRFIYIKSPTTWWPQYTFTWLKSPIKKVKVTSPVVLSEEESLFWAKAIPMPSSISVNEYKLPPPPSYLPNNELPNNPYQYIPTPTPFQGAESQTPSPTPRKITLQELGYERREAMKPVGEFMAFNQQLLRDGRVLFDHVTGISDIYVISSDISQIVAFTVDVNLGQQRYVIENDIIYSWNGYFQYTSAPILYQEELLWARVNGGHVEIVKSDGTIVFTLAWPNFPNHYPKLRAWNKHWILEASDFVIQDGENLNEKLEYQQMFNWGLVQGNPTYFFRKGSKVGISFNGYILPLQFDEVWHGQCCGGGAYNASVSKDRIIFFGKRDGSWYYVTMDFN